MKYLDHIECNGEAPDEKTTRIFQLKFLRSFAAMHVHLCSEFVKGTRRCFCIRASAGCWIFLRTPLQLSAFQLTAQSCRTTSDHNNVKSQAGSVRNQFRSRTAERPSDVWPEIPEKIPSNRSADKSVIYIFAQKSGEQKHSKPSHVFSGLRRSEKIRQKLET